MRLLHTSDWHLGRSFHRADLLGAQAGVIDALVETVRAERVDAVLVAGDVYDRALPPVDAVALWDDALARLAGTGAAVVVISGNHDSSRRVGCHARLMEAGRVHVRTDVRRAGEPVLLEDASGPVALYALPYLEPDAVRDQLDPSGERALRGHEQVLRAAAGLGRADLAARPGTRSVVMAHAFVTGGAVSDSERDIAVGGVSSVPLDVFAGADYVALGHLHGRQSLDGGRVRYSGSPLAYSFSEARHVKGSWLVELGPDGLERVDAVPAPVGRRLALLEGTVPGLLADPALSEHEQAYCSAVLTDAQRPADPMARLQVRFPHLLTLEWRPAGSVAGAPSDYAGRTRGRPDLDVAREFVAHVRGAAVCDPEVALLREAFEATRREEVSA